MNCNCTFCTKTGYLNAYPKKDDITVIGKGGSECGDEPWTGGWLERVGLNGYTREDIKESCTHLFCEKCGGNLFALPPSESTERKDVAINVSLGSSC
jgi:hypothetical protein